MTDSLLGGLGIELPVLAAPMAGGGSTPALVVAAAEAGSLGFVPGGYRTADDLGAQIAAVRGSTERFGVNLFAPNPVPIEPTAYRRYRDEIRADVEALGAGVGPESPVEDDDAWGDKVALLLEQPVPVVSFTFGIPEPGIAAALERAGTLVAQTVTTGEEAVAAEQAGVRLLVVQSSAAGGHSGTLTPDRPLRAVPLPALVAEIRARTRLPVIGAGGVAGPDDVRDALGAGAEAVAVGTLLLRSAESGASATHRAALADPAFTATTVTRAFTGRPARGLRNAFTDAHPDAPLGYPALHHLTSPMRRAAAQAGDPQRLHLWAGTGFRSAREARAAEILRGLAS